MGAWTLRRLGGSTGGSYSLLVTGRGGESRSKSEYSQVWVRAYGCCDLMDSTICMSLCCQGDQGTDC